MFLQERGGQDVPMYDDETLEDLQRGGFRLLQKRTGFRFGTDSVLLSAYAADFYRNRRTGTLRIADLGAGSGAVSLLLAARLMQANISAIEIDPISIDLINRNGLLNHVADRLIAVEADIAELAKEPWPKDMLAPGAFDLVVSNPPYFLPEQSWNGKRRTGGDPPGTLRRAREETSLTLSDLLWVASRLLKPRGRLVMIHRVGRLPEILQQLSTMRLEPRTLRLVQTRPDRAPATCLVSAVYQGKPGGFRAEAPLIIHNAVSEEGSDSISAEVAAWYGHEEALNHETLFRGVAVMKGKRQGGDAVGRASQPGKGNG